MIKINLLAQRRTRRGDQGQQSLAIGMLVIIATGVLVFLLVHLPLASDISDLEERNQVIGGQNAALQAKLSDEKAVEAALAQLEARKAAIVELRGVRATPAYLMRELARILTPNRQPRMSKEMSAKVETSRHRELADTFDPKHVWIVSFREKSGLFEMTGGALGGDEVTQLAKRLDASVYFADVKQKDSTQTTDQASGTSYYRFTITGKVIY